ncbi:condensation domain-containing protein, partial [Streptomyces sp. NPDC048208]|uniref:condensation domain-containing protein n=1 Tax=Streptomyces sp. NPDC048208 TaxID=3365515 RepID=UPI0037112461
MLIPLSFAQYRLWFVTQLEGNNSVYNIPMPIRMIGALSAGALHQALRDVISRHESLRTLFPHRDGTPEQEILTPGSVGDVLTTVDASAWTEDELRASLQEAAGHRFDLACEVPLRAVLFTVGVDEHVLVLV